MILLNFLLNWTEMKIEKKRRRRILENFLSVKKHIALRKALVQLTLVILSDILLKQILLPRVD